MTPKKKNVQQDRLFFTCSASPSLIPTPKPSDRQTATLGHDQLLCQSVQEPLAGFTQHGSGDPVLIFFLPFFCTDPICEINVFAGKST